MIFQRDVGPVLTLEGRFVTVSFPDGNYDDRVTQYTKYSDHIHHISLKQIIKQPSALPIFHRTFLATYFPLDRHSQVRSVNPYTPVDDRQHQYGPRRL